MAKPYDAALNALIDAHPADWANFLAARVGLPPGPAEPLDTDLSATLQADRLFRTAGPPPAVLHLELESTGRLGIPGELLRYNVAAHAVTALPVYSVVVLLRPKATATDLTGTHHLPGPAGVPYLTFRYTVVRVWQEAVGGLLAAGPGLTPLALLTNEAAGDLGAAFDRVVDRLRRPDVPGKVAEDLLGSVYVLGGLRYATDRLRELFMKLSMILEDSVTYQDIMQKGEAKGEAKGRAAAGRRLALRLGTERFGPPPAAAEAALAAVADPDRLERIAVRTLHAAGWDDLLATP